MLKQVEFKYRFLIFLILLFANPWLKNLLLLIYSAQALPIDAGMKLNGLLFQLSGWQIKPLMVIALMLCFWPIFIPKLINFILHQLKYPTIKPIPLMIYLIWLILITDFIFMQQGLS